MTQSSSCWLRAGQSQTLAAPERPNSMMEFTIPAPDSLARYTSTALQDLALEAAAAFDSLREGLTPETATDAQLDDLDDLRNFMLLVDEELASRTDRATRFNAITAPARPLPAGTEVVEKEEEEEEAKEEKPSTKAKTPPSTEMALNLPSVKDIATSAGNNGAALEGEILDAGMRSSFTILAAADTGYSAGAELGGWLDVARAFVNRSRTHGGGTAQQSTVAVIRRDFSDQFAISEGDDDISIMRKIDFARDEKNLEGGSLLAGVGWCAPSETIYTTCNQITADGMYKSPEIGARRGGIRHNQGIQFDTIFGGGTGYNILTEAQVIADTSKTCVAVPCPSFVDDRLKVAALCLTGDILQNRGYPEFVSEFVQGAVAAQAHNVNRQIIADIVADSTAVAMTCAPWASDGTVLSQVMSAVEVSAVDIKYRLRLQRDSTLEVIFPYWLMAQIRADWIRRNGPMDPDLLDNKVNSMLATRGVRAQWVYDWQDSFTSVGVSGGPFPGSDTPICALPTSLQYLMYPAGTWVVARQDVIRLDTIYDSVNITTNKVTQLFLEDGFRAMRFCPVSRVYTIAICPGGETGAQRDVSC
jgi:hypothetical protein